MHIDNQALVCGWCTWRPGPGGRIAIRHLCAIRAAVLGCAVGARAGVVSHTKAAACAACGAPSEAGECHFGIPPGRVTAYGALMDALSAIRTAAATLGRPGPAAHTSHRQPGGAPKLPPLWLCSRARTAIRPCGRLCVCPSSSLSLQYWSILYPFQWFMSL